MPMAEIRRRAVQGLIERRFGGVQARFGTAIGRQADYVSRIVHGRKALGEKLAREIERSLGLERGFLDRDPFASESVEITSGAPALHGLVPITRWESVVQYDHEQAHPTKEDVQDQQLAPRLGGLSDDALVLAVRGPAMEPEFRDGWAIYAERADRAEHGQYVIALPEGRKTPLLRQLSIEGDVTYLRALNPLTPEPMIPLGTGAILGRVVAQARRY